MLPPQTTHAYTTDGSFVSFAHTHPLISSHPPRLLSDRSIIIIIIIIIIITTWWDGMGWDEILTLLQEGVEDGIHPIQQLFTHIPIPLINHTALILRHHYWRW